MKSRAESRESDDFDRLIEQAYRELENARRIAQSIITNARHEAVEMINRAKAQAHQAAEQTRSVEAEAAQARARELEVQARQAYEQGFGEGLDKGTEEGRRRFEAIVSKVGGILDHLSRERERVMAGYRQEMIELVLQICDRVMRLEHDSVATLLGENLRLLLEETTAADESVLFLNPVDFDEVARHLGEHAGALPRHRLRSDPLVPVGECRIRGKGLNVDVSFERRFEAIRDRLRVRFGRGVARPQAGEDGARARPAVREKAPRPAQSRRSPGQQSIPGLFDPVPAAEEGENPGAGPR